MIKTFNNGLLDSNTYVYSTNDGHAMIIDFGIPLAPVKEYAEKNKLTVDYLVLTHGHYDHINYIGDYKKAFPKAKIVCHENELDLVRDPEGNLSLYFGLYNSYDVGFDTVKNDDEISLKSGEEYATFKVIHTPGHTSGCMCLYNENEKIMFTGDVLFANGYGRVDLKYASPSDMIKSLNKLYTYKGVKIYAGHGSSGII
ncbi:MAG: MBL fold metallo-hydrolase [Clostridia bacterium]|nr:MBL fold metallo-hydrolase [Clostridia bacterium]